jgi:hypothetical protein
VTNLTAHEPELRYTILPDVHTWVSFTADPYSIWTLGQSPIEPALTLVADPSGVVRVCFYTDVAAPDDRTRFVFQNESAGRRDLHIVEIRSAERPTPRYPFPRDQELPGFVEGTVRPALSRSQAQRLSNQELTDRGYPPRPPAEVKSNAYELWEECVTREMVAAETREVPIHGNLRMQGFPNSAPIQAGFGLLGGGIYRVAYAQWNVPQVSSVVSQTNFAPAGQQAVLALWPGLGGIDFNAGGEARLIQAGTYCSATTQVSAGGIVTSAAAPPQTWGGFLPTGVFSWFTNPQLNPGDQVSVFVTIEVDPNNGNLPIGRGQWQLANLTQGWYLPPNAKVGMSFGTNPSNWGVGHDAEWIIERPSTFFTNGTVVENPLASFATPINVRGASSWVMGVPTYVGGTLNETLVAFTGDINHTSSSFPMNNGNPLCTATAVAVGGVEAIQFQWVGFQ